MALTYLSIGGNLGYRFSNLARARLLIEENIGRIDLKSSVYETEPWGFVHKNLFLNQIVGVRTLLSPFEILSEIKKIETVMGRKRTGKERYEGRRIDIDILFYNNEIIDTAELTVPHPEMTKRKFVLIPLAEIATTKIHPVLNKTVDDLLRECQDNGEVKKVSLKIRRGY